jgi:hypothetical protein
MLFQWYDPIHEVTVQFTCKDEAKFEEVLVKALQEFRLKSRLDMGTSFYYPLGWLEIYNDHKWMKIFNPFPFKPGALQYPVEICSRGAFILDTEAPDDSLFYKTSLSHWWRYAVAITLGARLPATAAPERQLAAAGA